MSQECEAFEQKLNTLMLKIEELMQELIILRRDNPKIKTETAKIMENQLIILSKRLKELSRINNDDLTAGISLLKIKMMG